MSWFGGSSHQLSRVARTVVWAVMACAMAAASGRAGEPGTSQTRLAEKVKVRRHLRAAERASMAPRAPKPAATAARVTTQGAVAVASAPAAAPAATAARLFDAKDAGKVEGAAGTRPSVTASSCVITGRALLGEPQLARFAQRIGEVDVERCFTAIAAWKTIKQEELRPTRARYHFLMRQANLDLQRAIAAAAARRGVTLVVERGGIQNAGDKSIDLTQSVLDALQSAP